MGMNWNNAAEQLVAGSLGMVPEVGAILAALVYIFWPEDDNAVWDQIESQVEALIDQKIDTLVYSQVSDSLTGLQQVVNDYTDALGTQDPGDITSYWRAADAAFDLQGPSFQQPGYELLLLPLFAGYANLNLALLRDGALTGASWGWDNQVHQSIVAKLQARIKSFEIYAEATYLTGLNQTALAAPQNNHECQPFRAINAFNRQMILTVLDFKNLWPYFDTVAYPQPVSVYLPREIYSDPMGTADNSGDIVIPSAPTQPILQFTVWGGDRIDAVQVHYPDDCGPGGCTTTARMGGPNGSNRPPHGAVITVGSENPVVMASGLAGDIVNALFFDFQDNTSTGALGGGIPGGSPFNFFYARQILSSIHVNGMSQFYQSADAIVFGFKYPQSQTADFDALRMLYVSAPVLIPLDALAARAVAKPVALADLRNKAAAEDWDQQRVQYRARRRRPPSR